MDIQEEFQIDGHPQELMDLAWVAWRLDMNIRTLAKWINKREIELPEPVKLGTGARPHIRYRRQEVNDWIATQ